MAARRCTDFGLNSPWQLSSQGGCNAVHVHVRHTCDGCIPQPIKRLKRELAVREHFAAINI